MVLVTMISAALLGGAMRAPQFPVPGQLEQHRVVMVGWHDELDSRSHWRPLDMLNKAFVATPTTGTLFLGLDQVPPNWPYQYQWSGLTQDAYVDVAKFPVLMARVNQVQGYAHLDIDVLGPNGNVLDTLRSSTLNAPGLTSIDFTGMLPAQTNHLRLRLIVGGLNEGCCATYDWVRFVTKPDADFLKLHPDWSYVRLYGNVMR